MRETSRYKSLLVIIYCLVFSFYTIQIFSNRLEEQFLSSLESIANTLNGIGFPLDVNLTFRLHSTLYFLILSAIIIWLVKDKNPSTIKEYFTFILSLFIYNLFSLLITFSLTQVNDFSRWLVLISGVLFVVLFVVFYFMLDVKYFKEISSIVFIFLISSYVFSNLNNTDESSLELHTDKNYSEISFTEGLTYENSEDCSDWAGSSINVLCITGSEVEILSRFPSELNSVINFQDNMYFLDVNGLIYLNSPENIFLDLRDLVPNKYEKTFNGEDGIIGLAFHPTDKYFLVSYVNFSNELIVERYELNSEYNPIVGSNSIVISIPNPTCCHVGGTIIWSNYFQDFLLGVGDMRSNTEPFTNGDPLSTTSVRGKVILLSLEISSPPLISENKYSNPRNDILAYGLRNPYKIYEHNENLFIPDVGFNNYEELNILDLNQFSENKSPSFYGWPLFEGLLNNEVEFLETNFWDDDGKTKTLDFLNNIKKDPILFYDHQAPTTYRAAIIGGEVISDELNNFNNQYFFVDYLSKELFLFDYQNQTLNQFPLPDIPLLITSIIKDIEDKYSFLITTRDGSFMKITIPSDY